MKNMKKLIAVILSILLVTAIPMSVSATFYENPADRINDPYAYIYPHYEEPLFPIEYYTEKEIWDTFKYTAEDGTVYYYSEALGAGESAENWIVSKENNFYMYQILPDETVAISMNPFIGHWEMIPELFIPETIDGKTVSVIGSFQGSNAKSIRLPDTIKSIRAMASDFSTLRYFIPKSVEEICVYGLFNRAYDVYYEGTESQWNEISFFQIGDNWSKGYYEEKGFNPQEYFTEVYGDDTHYSNIHFNANPNNYECFEEEDFMTVWDKIAQAFENFADSIVVFFEKVANFFANLFA